MLLHVTTHVKKITIAALNRDNTARLAHGESHVSTCNPPRAKKGNCSTPFDATLST